MSKSDLRKKAEIAPNTMTKLRRDEEVSLTKSLMILWMFGYLNMMERLI